MPSPAQCQAAEVAKAERKALYQRPGTVTIDARSPKEYEAGTLTKALNIVHSEVPANVDRLPAAKDTTILVFCRRGVRAGKAREALVGLGYTNVVNVGGYDDVKDFDE